MSYSHNVITTSDNKQFYFTRHKENMEVIIQKNLGCGIYAFCANTPIIFRGDSEQQIIFNAKVKDFKIITFINRTILQPSNVQIQISENQVKANILLSTGYDIVYFRQECIFLAYVKF